MGNLFSNKKQQLSPEEEQRRLQMKYGVMVPPVFTVSREDGYIMDSSGGVTTPPISTQQLHTIQTNANPSLQPSIVEYLWRMSAGNNLLTEYMTPGLFFAGKLLCV